MRLAAVEIYNEITGYWLWPFGTPDIERVIDRSMRRVARLISKDYRAPIKVQCCGFTIFRCCCRKRDPKSGVLNSIWTGVEDREREMMNVRGVADYVDTGARRTSGRSGFEDDAYAADQELQRMENGSHYDDASRSYYSRDSRGSYYSQGEYSDHQQQTVYTEDGDSYARGIAAGEQGGRSGPGWDEASESQYGSRY